jgi:hypothetical protein
MIIKLHGNIYMKQHQIILNNIKYDNNRSINQSKKRSAHMDGK